MTSEFVRKQFSSFLAVSILAAVPAVLVAQTASAASSAPPATVVTAPQLSFDVVSIRQNTSGSREMQRQSASNTDDITLLNVPLALVVYYAYSINDEAGISGMPEWAFGERYDVTAKVDPANLAAYHVLTNQQRAAMLQPVLANRFKLRVHTETKDRRVYDLVIAKGGSKLKEATPGEAHPNTAKADPNGMHHGSTIFITGPGEITGEAASMRDLALTLSSIGIRSLGGSVIDKTGLTGKYDFTLQVSSPASGGDEAQHDAGASLFTAVQEQLGLKLQPSTASTEQLVIDHIEQPSAN